MAKTNLDSGFLILYDWLPAFRSLDGEELKKLLFALIDNQREGTPLPDFDNPITAIFAQMIAPTIKRRLDGLVSATKGSKSATTKSQKANSNFQEPTKAIGFAPPKIDFQKSDRLAEAIRSEMTVEDTMKDMLKSATMDSVKDSVEDTVEGTVEGMVEGSLHLRKEEIRKAEISGAKIRKAERSEAEVSGADIHPPVSDTDLSATEFARRLMEELSKNPPKPLYRE